MAIKLLSDAERQTALKGLSSWAMVEGRNAIGRTLKFRNFKDAWGFMTRVALAAEAMDHHPEWRNVWNTVEIVLATHEAGGLTERDIRLADQIDDFATQVGLQ